MIRNLLFDLGGVLADLDRERCMAAFAQIGLPQLGRLVDPYYPSAIFNDLERGIIGKQEILDYARTFSPQADLERIEWAYFQLIGEIPAYKLDLLRDLRSRFKVYMLSNTNVMVYPSMLEKQFRSRGLTVDAYFDKVYLSYEMKLLKPDPAIFEAVLDDAGIEARETLFIDDGTRNIETARAMGFRTYQAAAHEDFRHLFAGLE